MKALKITAITVLSLVLVIITLFTVVLPNVLNLNNYKPMIYSGVKDASNLDLTIDDLRITPSFSCKLKISADGIKVNYPTKENLAKLKSFNMEISLLPLLVKTLKIDKVEIAAPEINLTMLKNGEYTIQKYLEENLKQEENPQPLPIKISNDLPKILVSSYLININDKSNSKTYRIKGNEFNILELILDKKIKLAVDGELDYSGKDKITYDIKISSFLPKMATEQPAKTTKSQQKPTTPAINIFQSLIDYKIASNVKVDLTVTNPKDDLHLKGFVVVDDVSYNIAGEDVKNSSIKLDFNRNKVDILSNLELGQGEKASINGHFINGRKQAVDLQVKSSKLTLSNMKNLGIALLSIAHVPNDLHNFRVGGYLEPNFSIKSDMKKIESSGKLSLIDGSITHKTIPLNINAMNSVLDFTGNAINIKTARANVNGSKVEMKGKITTDAFSDITVTASNLQLVPLVQAFAPKEISNAYHFKSGTLNLEAYLKGRLDKILPKLNVSILNLAIVDKVNKIDVSLPNTSLNIATTKDNISAKGVTRNLLIYSKDLNTKITALSPTVEFDMQDLKLLPSDFRLNGSIINVRADVKDYQKAMKADLLVKGRLNTADLMNFVPKEAKSMVKNSGSLPIIAVVTTDGKKTEIDAQILASPGNYITPLDLKEHLGRNSILSLSSKIDGDVLHLQNLGLYYLNSSNGLSENLNGNLKGAVSTAGISGKVDAISSKNPVLSNIRIITNDKLSASIPGFKNSYVAVKSNMNINGSVSNPKVTGEISIPSVNIPDMFVNGENIELKFVTDAINARVGRLGIKSSELNLIASLSPVLGKDLIVNNLIFNSSNLNLDEIMSIMANMPNSNVSPSASVPVQILNGQMNIDRFKMGTFFASNVKSNLTLKNNVAKISGMTANAYNGTVAGDIDYNVPYESMNMTMNGKLLDSAPVIQALLGMKDVAQGKMDFSTKLAMRGSTQEQQMKSLKGHCDFNISNGRVGALGSFETFLNAQNLISQKMVKATLSQTLRLLSTKDTGKFSNLKGNMTFSNGFANISPIQMSGNTMSFYLTGSLNLLNNYGNLEFLGRISQEVVSLLGPVGDLSLEGLLGNIPKFGATASALVSNYNAEVTQASLNKIPYLITGAQAPSKCFKVNINGNLQSVGAVKSFKWLSTSEEIKASQSQILKQLFPSLNTTTNGASTTPTIPIPKQLDKPIQILKEFMPQNTQTPTTTTPVKRPTFNIPDFVNKLPD